MKSKIIIDSNEFIVHSISCIYSMSRSSMFNGFTLTYRRYILKELYKSRRKTQEYKLGEPGKRFALPNASIMIHQPSGGAAGQASDIAIHAREILRVRERLNRIYQKHTGIREIETVGRHREW